MRVIKSSLVGVTFNNRQERVKLLQKEQQLFFIHEKDNIYDANSILLFLRADDLSSDVGHLRRELAADFVKGMAEGKSYDIFVEGVTGGGDKKSYGVNIRIFEKSPGD